MKLILIPGSEKLKKAMEPAKPKETSLEVLERMTHERLEKSKSLIKGDTDET